MEESFVNMQNDFCAINCEPFEDSEENKLCYMDIFGKYTEMLENYIELRLTEEIPGFTMEKLGDLLSHKQDEMTGDVFDMLMSFTDFEEFKGLMLSHKDLGGGTLKGFDDTEDFFEGAEGSDLDGSYEEQRGKIASLDGCLGIVSKGGNAAVGTAVLSNNQFSSPIKENTKPSSVAQVKMGVATFGNFDALSPASREAKDAGLSP